ncbi:hypothetical protein FBU31_003680 [Coemansia sp. 'formosensis']|nr:hypothetical protein FBU31_003680 [Coemansia sp. 'formosensis']
MEGGPSIRDYIDARKKSGMSWEEFRALKDKNEGSEFSDSAMLSWRKQLDAEREAKLNRGQPMPASGDDRKSKRAREKRSSRRRDAKGSDGEAGSSSHHRRARHRSSKHRRDDSRGRSRSRSPAQHRHRHGHSHRRRSSSPAYHDRKDKGPKKSDSATVDDDANPASRKSVSPEMVPRRDRQPGRE